MSDGEYDAEGYIDALGQQIRDARTTAIAETRADVVKTLSMYDRMVDWLTANRDWHARGHHNYRRFNEDNLEHYRTIVTAIEALHKNDVGICYGCTRDDAEYPVYWPCATIKLLDELDA